MNTRARRTDAANVQNKIIGKNLRFIRHCRKMTLERLAAAAGCRYQQIGKYELGVDQMSAYRVLQLSQILKCKLMALEDFLIIRNYDLSNIFFLRYKNTGAIINSGKIPTNK